MYDIDTRIDMAETAINNHASAGNEDGLDNHTKLTDLLANLMHWALAHGVDFEAATTMAEIHFNTEQDDACENCGNTDNDGSDTCVDCGGSF